VSSGLVTIVDRKYECTELGHITATSYLHVLTAIFIKNAFAELHTDTRLEVESMINIVLRALIIESGERLVMNQRAVMKAIVEWIDERNEETITGSKALVPGDFHELIVEVARLANAAANVARLLRLVNLSKDLSTIGKRIRFGVREELLPLVELSIPSIGRKSARALYDLGYTGLDELGRASVEELAEVVKVHESTASMIIEYVARIINHRLLASLS
jgi:replicative superfamily II helicase